MHLSFNLKQICALYPGVEEQDPLLQTLKVDPNAALPKIKKIPMLTARRLTYGNRLSLEAALTLMQDFEPSALVFSSRHSELEHNFNILKALALKQDISPTEFTMSVHNSAIGNLSIFAKKAVVTTATAAGADTFLSLLLESYGLLHDGMEKVIAVDFDGAIPKFYQPYFKDNEPKYPHGVALVLEKGSNLIIDSENADNQEQDLPQALDFYLKLKTSPQSFKVKGLRFDLNCKYEGRAL